MRCLCPRLLSLAEWQGLLKMERLYSLRAFTPDCRALAMHYGSMLEWEKTRAATLPCSRALPAPSQSRNWSEVREERTLLLLGKFRSL